jgi:prevent-host-death family protein
MTMITMASVEAQNGFGNLLDKAQRQMVSVTRRGRPVALVMSPEVLEDYVDARLAMQAEAEGFATTKETTDFLASLRHA